ncbi:hypothetical protein GIW81_14005 [Hyphomicrobium sp. xq]|uniref:Uncharacterized protein n=1 Tax=Hyphomicrobium album TaxID=2665159 RepID=A0A6I3KLZ0_9HYPH|nr:hypothetical protein [Hyphomicrobium album]MTD95449.1 hypothetical protein [Hyphomicrobium album]
MTEQANLKQAAQEHMALVARRHDAREHQRRLMQGLGRPIISWENSGHRFVAVSDELLWDARWRTFTDFLFHYVKHVLTVEWGAAELAKSPDRRHPLFKWHEKVREEHLRALAGNSGNVVTGVMTGAVRAYLGLAYDLYLCAHNAVLPELLLKRLRNPDQFEGAVYETFVIGCFAKAGFAIEFEDEGDSTTSHCEFTATHKQTGRKFSVEAKAVTSAAKRSGGSAEPPKIRGQLARALRKKVAHPRIVFIELARAHAAREDGTPAWLPHVEEQLEICERELTIDGSSPPSAYLFVTNRAYAHELDAAARVEQFVAGGFKIDDFPPGRNAASLLAMHKARKKHIEVHWLFKAIEAHRLIPESFDERLPEETCGALPKERLRVGETYLVPDANGTHVPGVLVDGEVMPPDSEAYGTYRLENGKHILCKVALSDAEMAAYKRSPDTFFGVLKPESKGINHPLDAFDFVFDTYSKSSREKLLEFMASWSEIDRLRSLSQPELAEHYAATLGAQMWAEIASGKTKLTKD